MFVIWHPEFTCNKIFDWTSWTQLARSVCDRKKAIPIHCAAL